MSPRNFIWLVVAAVLTGAAVAIVIFTGPAVTFRVLGARTVSGASVAHVTLHNGSGKPLVYYAHTLGHKPAYQWLERYGRSWHHALRDSECGIDLVPATLAPGQTLSFSASIIDTGSPARLALPYQQDGLAHTASTRTIFP